MSLRSSKELTPEQRRERRKLLASSGEARLEYIKGVTTDSEFQQAKTLPPSLPDKPVPAKPQPGDFSQLPTLLMQAAKNNSRLWKTLHRWLLITITVLLFFTITPLRTASIFNLCSIWLGVELFVGALFATIRQLLPSGEPDEKNKSVQNTTAWRGSLIKIARLFFLLLVDGLMFVVVAGGFYVYQTSLHK